MVHVTETTMPTYAFMINCAHHHQRSSGGVLFDFSIISWCVVHRTTSWLINLALATSLDGESLSNDTYDIDSTASLWNGHRLGLRSNCRPYCVGLWLVCLLMERPRYGK